MRIPEDTIARISASVDIVDVISEVVTLKKSGINYFGLCPFHSEKTPSFSVSPHKRIFYCFGCGAGGNLYAFVMKYNGVSFPEAVQMMGRRCGIPVETGPVDPEKEKAAALREQLFRLNQQVMDYCHRRLVKSGEAEAARQYLEKRGITRDTIDTFQLGFVPDRWDDMVCFLRQLKVTRKLAEQSGLVLARRQSSGYYDRFRNRIMFPIWDITTQVAGFGGRVMNQDPPKYLNSPETPVYHKGRILYGFNLTRTYCRQADAVYIVEGYFDLISLFQNGIKNCAATLGTALTEDHVRLIKGATTRAVLVFDSDTAGVRAAERSIDTFLKEGVDVSVALLPEGEDPDSLVREQGAAVFEKYMASALPVIPFLTRTCMERHGLSVSGRVKILDEMKHHLARVTDRAARSLYIREMAQTLDMDEAAVIEKVRDVLRGTTAETVQQMDTAPGAFEMFSDLDRKAAPREKQMIAMLLQHPEIADTVDRKGVLNCFYCSSLKEIGFLVLSETDPDNVVEQVLDKMTSEAGRNLVASLAMTELPDMKDVRATALCLMERITGIWDKNENSMTGRIKMAEQESDPSLCLELLARHQEQIRKRRGYDK